MKAIELIYQAITPAGFTASTIERHNYKRVWARDSVITGLAALVTKDDKLIAAFRQSLLTLAQHQGKAGQIPSNVAVETQQVSYGSSAGRVDATLWFIIGVGQYYAYTGDATTIEQLRPKLVLAKQVLRAWEYNEGGLLYVPDTGDWADEYTRGGYVLYDQLLYLRAQQEYAALFHESPTHQHLLELIQKKYWLKQYWSPAFSPFGQQTYFDSFANVLANLFNVSSPDQAAGVDLYIAEHFGEKAHYLLPAFDPIIKPTDPAWQELNQAFNFEFKNKPHHYHNGGLWPMLSGWYVMDLIQRQKKTIANKYLVGLQAAIDNNFPEYIDSEFFKPGGTSHLAWSAAAVILANYAVTTGQSCFKDPIQS